MHKGVLVTMIAPLCDLMWLSRSTASFPSVGVHIYYQRRNGFNFQIPRSLKEWSNIAKFQLNLRIII